LIQEANGEIKYYCRCRKHFGITAKMPDPVRRDIYLRNALEYSKLTKKTYLLHWGIIVEDLKIYYWNLKNLWAIFLENKITFKMNTEKKILQYVFSVWSLELTFTKKQCLMCRYSKPTKYFKK
jgi:hypothetical protein